MSVQEVKDDETEDRNRRPPRAVVGSHRVEEEAFGKAYDPRIIRRISSNPACCNDSLSNGVSPVSSSYSSTPSE